MRRFLPVALGLVLLFGCTAIAQQKAIPSQPDQLEFKNLKVLPPNITHDELIATMRTIARSLGTRCEHCHVQTATTPRETFDFASDAKKEKNVARTMLVMTRQINTDYIAKINEHSQAAVTCGTCHRGKTVPENWQPPAPPQQPQQQTPPTPPPS